ncbi:MAG TPA: NusG domain II-containing protein [Clostridiales bacterium]|nr:NusG domain II-containing protein [Clostridiales bacterium]
MKNLKIGDIFIYILLVVFAAIGFIGMKSMVGVEGKSRVVLVLLDGQEVEEIRISPDMEKKEIRIDTGNGTYNIVSIDGDGVRVVEASCSDKLCIKQGNIDSPGQSIVCLPNKLVIKIIGDNNSPIDDITY